MRCAVVQPFTSTCRIQCATATLVRQPLCRLPRQLTRTYAGDNEGPETSKASVDDGVLPPEEIKKLAALRRQQQAELSQDSNLLQGAVEEAQLITWPTREKALLDTVLVLFIVAASGAMIFGMNVLLAELSEWWYHLA